MKLSGIILLAVATASVTARHKKEWQKEGPLKTGRERLQTFYKSDIPACTKGAGFYRDPQDCHQYIRCVDEFGNGRQFSVFVGRCEPGLVFDENVSACNWPELAAPCNSSPQKLQEIRKQFKPEQVPESNFVTEGKTWIKPSPVQEQHSIQINHIVQQQPVAEKQQSSNAYETQQLEVPVVQEIQIAAQEPIYQDKIEQVFTETQNSEEPFEGQVQEQGYDKNVQTPEVQEQVYQQDIQQPEVQEQVHQENVQEPEVQEQVHQENVQEPEVQEQVYQQNVQVPEVQQQNFGENSQYQQNEQQIIFQENNQNDRSDASVKPDQASSGGFQEIDNQQAQQFEIPQQAQLDEFPQQESQSEWWVPEGNPQHSPPEVAEQIPASEANREPVFCSQEGFYRHPENCSQFIRCVKIQRGAYAVHFFECPTQLVFDEKDSACIVADIHSCQSNTRKKRQASNSKLRCKGEGFFRHPEDCRSFYRCVKTSNGSYETHLFSCPANLVFDEEYTTCNWPEKAPPCDSQQQSYKPTRKPVKPVQTERPRSQYEPPSRTTSRGSWSTAKPRNDFIDKSITQETYGKRRNTQRPKSTTPSAGVCRNPGFFRNDYDCTKFIKCVKRGNYFIRYDLSCPKSFAYDSNSKRCVAERYVTSCNRNKPPYPPRQDDEGTTTTSAPESSSSSDSSTGNDNIKCEKEGYFRNPEDCNKFYRCVDFEGNGQEFVRYDFNCAEGLVFDEANSVCNWPDQSAPCDTRSGGDGEGTEQDGGSDDNQTGGNEAEESGGNEAEESGGNEAEESGGNDEREPETSTSQQPTTESVEASSSAPTDEEEQESGSSNESGGSSSENECTKEGFYRNPDDCNKFYRCVDFDGEGKEFVRYDFTCPEGLVFDEANSVCNWPAESEPCDTRSGGESGQDGSDGTTSSSPGGERESSEDSSSNQQTTPRDNGPSESTTDRSPSSESSSDGPQSSTESSNEGTRGGSSGECTEEGFFRNPDDCNKFYRCVDQNGDGKQLVRYDFTCPEGLVFDEANSVCNWPDQSAPCDGGNPGREQSSTSGSGGDGSESSQTTTSSSRSSSEEATEGTTSSTTSSTTQRTTRSTDSEETSSSTTERSTGSSESESTSSTSDSGSKGNQGECTEEGFFRNPDDCNKFYRCVDFNGDGQQFVRYDFECPEGLVFDEVNSVCNWPDQTPACETRSGSGGNESTDSGSGSTSQTESSSEQPQSSTEQTTQSSPQEPTESSTRGTTEQSTSDSSTSGDSSECTEPGFYRCKDDCSKFYRCVDENGRLVRYDFRCPDGLIFDDQNKKCDWPSSENTCDTESSSSTTTSAYESSTTSSTTRASSTTQTSSSTTQASTSSSGTTSSGSSSKECTEEGYFRDPDDCSKYYRCLDEGDGTFTREDFSCAEDEVFDEEMRYCNRKDLAPPCDGSETTSSQSQTTSSQTRTTSSESQSTTERSTTTTQSSTERSTTTTQSSTERSTTAQSTTESSTKSDGSSECPEPGFYRCPEDCTKFYRCIEDSNGNLVRYDFHCPDGLIFDERKKKCDWPSSELTCDTESSTSSSATESSTSDSQTSGTTSQSTSSSSGTTSSSSGTTSSSGSTSAEGCTEEGYFRNPEDCSKYYRCIDEGDGTLTREDFACEEDEVFDEEMRYCNRKDLAPPCDGSSSTTDSSGSSTTQTAEQGSESTTSSSRTTAGGESTTSSSQTSGSESTTSSSQTSGSESTTSSSGSTSGSSGSGECTEEGFHRDPNDCNKFYRCVDFQGDGQSFTRYDFECPEGLVFDETNDVCNWPSSVPSCESNDGAGGSTESSTSAGRSSDTTSETSSSSSSTTPAEQSSSTSSTTSEEQTSSTSSGTDSTTRSEQTSSDSSTSSESGTTSSGSTTSRGSGSSDNIECTEEGFFRHPEDCNKFYRCVDFAGTGESYVRYDFDCPEGLVFDEVNSVCNWPNQSPACESGSRGSNGNNESGNRDSSDSSSTTSSTSESSTSESSSSDDSRTTQRDSSTTSRDQTTRSATSTTSSSSEEFRCEEEGYFKHPTDCKKYYECKRDEETGELVRIDCECPEGQVWDNEGWYCNAEELSPPCDSSDSSSSFKCREEGFFRDPEDCTRYYQCNRTGPGENDFARERHQCDDGLVFDEEGRYCNAPELSEPCDESSSTSSGTTSGESSGGTTSSESSGGTTSSESSGGTTSSESSGGTTSSESSRGTDGNGTSSGQGDCTREGFFRNPEDCTKYYLCQRNEETGDFDRTDYSCPDGRIFDEGSNYCNEPELSEEPCDSNNNGDSATTRQASTSGSTSSSGNRRAGGDPQCTQEGFFRHPDDCAKFYRCVDFSGTGESFVRYDFDCPEGTHFDEVNSVCNWPTMTPPCESGSRYLLRPLINPV